MSALREHNHATNQGISVQHCFNMQDGGQHPTFYKNDAILEKENQKQESNEKNKLQSAINESFQNTFMSSMIPVNPATKPQFLRKKNPITTQGLAK